MISLRTLKLSSNQAMVANLLSLPLPSMEKMHRVCRLIPKWLTESPEAEAVLAETGETFAALKAKRLAA